MELGKYLTSFLRIYINTNLELDSMKGQNLTDYEKRIFVHEYTHFLQNISGAFGHLHAWNVYDRLRQHIAELQKRNDEQIEIPLVGSVANEQETYLRIRKKMEGHYKVKVEMEDATTVISNIKFKKDEDIASIFPANSPIHHLALDLVDGNGVTMEYIFGESAVSETMALLMESKYFETDPADNFPYHVCRLLGRYMKVEFIENDEFLFALCDVALLSSYPGAMFYRILQDMQSKEKTPSTSEEIFEYGLTFMYSIGWQILEDYEKSMEGTCHVIQTLLNNIFFKETAEWVVYLFKKGYQCRIENRYFMIHLYREPVVFEGMWNNVIAQFGNPELHNNTPKRAFSAPLDLKHIEEQIEPIFLIALYEVQETLFKRKNKCDLVDFCKHSKKGLLVDDRCTTMPWERAYDHFLCAYAALWVTFGINNKSVILTDK